MTEKYPFFRDPDEQTRAVIGGEAVTSDLNGTYQKPYAVLTQKRLYCKNEQGNFIIGTDNVLGTGISKSSSTSKNFLWILLGIVIFLMFFSIRDTMWYTDQFKSTLEFYDISFIDLVINPKHPVVVGMGADSMLLSLSMLRMQLVVAIISLTASLILRIRLPKIAAIFLGANGLLSIILVVLSFDGGFTFTIFRTILLDVAIIALSVIICCSANNGECEWFEIRHSTGTFTFSRKLYPIGELKNFEKQIKALQEGGVNGQ